MLQLHAQHTQSFHHTTETWQRSSEAAPRCPTRRPSPMPRSDFCGCWVLPWPTTTMPRIRTVEPLTTSLKYWLWPCRRGWWCKLDIHGCRGAHATLTHPIHPRFVRRCRDDGNNTSCRWRDDVQGGAEGQGNEHGCKVDKGRATARWELASVMGALRTTISSWCLPEIGNGDPVELLSLPGQLMMMRTLISHVVHGYIENRFRGQTSISRFSKIWVFEFL